MQVDKENAKIIGQLVRETRLLDVFEDYGVDIRYWEISHTKNVWVSTVLIRMLYASSSEIFQFLPGFAGRFGVAMTMEC